MNGYKRIRFTKTYKIYRPGDVIWAKQSIAEFLLKNGFAIQSKDMTASDLKQKDLFDASNT
ncbi:MAG: hypothetical protein EPO02_13615 [Nitrospirae bacterium]|nr:MAG: hypothetical protein EPO02_13615 [Nitrospirota bacterium]